MQHTYFENSELITLSEKLSRKLRLLRKILKQVEYESARRRRHGVEEGRQREEYGSIILFHISFVYFV